MVENPTVYMDDKTIKTKKGKTEITINEQAISVSSSEIDISGVVISEIDTSGVVISE